MDRNEIMQSVGKRRVKVVDEETGAEIARGMLSRADFSLNENHGNQSEIAVAADLPPSRAARRPASEDMSSPAGCLPTCDWRGGPIHARGCPNAQ